MVNLQHMAQVSRLASLNLRHIATYLRLRDAGLRQPKERRRGGRRHGRAASRAWVLIQTGQIVVTMPEVHVALPSPPQKDWKSWQQAVPLLVGSVRVFPLEHRMRQVPVAAWTVERVARASAAVRLNRRKALFMFFSFGSTEMRAGL